MIDSGGGSIVFTASIDAYNGASTRVSYQMSKAAELALMRHIARKYGPKGIRANAIAPGLIWHYKFDENPMPDGIVDQTRARQMIKSRFGNARRHRRDGRAVALRRRQLHHRPDDQRRRRSDVPPMTQPSTGKYRPIMSSEPTPLTIMFWPESAYGPTNQCIGLAAILRDRGHTIVFAAESSWAGKLAPFGFIEELVDLAEPAEGAGDEDAGAFWTDFIAETAPEFRKPTIEQLGSFIQPTYQALIDGAKYCEPRLREIVAKHRPDVIVEDNVVLFPALVTSGAPFVRIVSCSPLEVTGPDVPPPFSGLPSADRSQWDAYRAEFDSTHRAMWSDFNDWVQAQGADPLRELEFMPHRTAANLYVYPAEADYLDARPLDDSWARMDSSVRETDEEYQLPAEVADRPEDSALVYFSLGSLGGADVAADAAGGRRARHHPAPLYRQQGTAG